MNYTKVAFKFTAANETVGKVEKPYKSGEIMHFLPPICQENGFFYSHNKQSKHRAQSRPRPMANCRVDGSVDVFASLAAVMLPMRQLLAFVKRYTDGKTD